MASTSVVEFAGAGSLRISNPELPGGEIEIRGGDSDNAVNIAMGFLRNLGKTVNVRHPLAESTTASRINGDGEQHRTNGRRKRRGVSKPRPWSEEDVKLLGTGTDAEVAKKLKRTPGAVTAQRKQRKVPAFGGGNGVGTENNGVLVELAH
jgi:hypothetical protein